VQLRQQRRSDRQEGQTSFLPTGVLISKSFKHLWHFFILLPAHRDDVDRLLTFGNIQHLPHIFIPESTHDHGPDFPGMGLQKDILCGSLSI
jgi:hypothetical protein